MISTLAGPAAGPGSIDGIGRAARFTQPEGVAVDAAGIVYVADTMNHTIRKIMPDGAVSTLAGTPRQSGSTDGHGAAARFNSPKALTVDAAGNVFVADTLNNTVRRITPEGEVTTWAGLAGQSGLVNGKGTAVRFRDPRGIAVDDNGNVYVADTANYSIRKIDATGTVTTFAGDPARNGLRDGQGEEAWFYRPIGLAVDKQGSVYVADHETCAVRKITPAGLVTTIVSSYGDRGTRDGPVGQAQLNQPSSVAVDAAGVIYVADWGNQVIRRISTDGVVSTFAGQPASADYEYVDGVGTQARFIAPWGIAAGPSAELYVVDYSASTVRKISIAGDVTTFAGAYAQSGYLDGEASQARFRGISDVAADEVGNIYVADSDGGLIRRIDVTGKVSTVAGAVGEAGAADGVGGAARFSNVFEAITTDRAGNVYVADTNNHAIRKVTPSGTVTTVAGKGGEAGFVNGPSATARFQSPYGVAVATDGTIYVGDTFNHVVRKVAVDGQVTTFAGAVGEPGSTDGFAGLARFQYPTDLDIDADGNLYVADTGNATVRRISPTGQVTTWAGTAGQRAHVDGEGSAARFASVTAVAVDQLGNVFVASERTHVIRKVSPERLVSTIAGQVDVEGYVDGQGDEALFSAPQGLAVDALGRLLVSDGLSVRTAMLAAPAILTQPSGAGVMAGGSLKLGVTVSGAGTFTYQWLLDGRPLAGETLPDLVVDDFTPARVGLYCVAAHNETTALRSEPAIVGHSTTSKVVGSGIELAPDILHSNGTLYDQILLQGPATTITADARQVTRASFVDFDNDIVQVELSGPGSVSLILYSAAGPATPENYNQPTVEYMKGHVGIVVADATAGTHLTIFSVGRVNAANQTLFKESVTYGGMADVAYVAIMSADGQFGGLRTANVNYYATQGVTGVYAPGVTFTGPVYVGEVTAFDDADPMLILGGAAGDTWITGGDLEQANGRAVAAKGLSRLEFKAGTTSHGAGLPAQINRARLEQDGVDVTDTIVVNP